jgi:hypothetical protein
MIGRGSCDERRGDKIKDPVLSGFTSCSIYSRTYPIRIAGDLISSRSTNDRTQNSIEQTKAVL